MKILFVLAQEFAFEIKYFYHLSSVIMYGTSVRKCERRLKKRIGTMPQELN